MLTIRREVNCSWLRCRHEGVDGPFGYGTEGIEKLALDGAQAPFPFLRYQVDAGVRAVVVGPLIPHPHLGETVAQDAWLLGQGGFHQAFEGATHTDQVGGAVTQVGESFVKIRHGN